MKHGIYIFTVLLCSIVFSGCRTRKHVVRNLEAQKEVEIVGKTEEQSTETRETGTSVRVQDEIEEREYTRTTTFDTTGNVQTIRETWRETGRAKLVVRHDTLRDISVTERTEETKQTENIDIIQNEVSEQIRDSRPRKLFWIWFLLAAVLAVSLYFKINPLRK